MPEIVNWSLLKEPLNWVIVALMVAIAAFGLCLLMEGGPPGLIHMSGAAGV